MKKLFVTFALALALIGQNLQGAEKYKTLVVNATTTTATYIIPPGELCHVMYLFYSSSGDYLTATMAGTIFELSGSPNMGGAGTNSRGQFFWHYAAGGEPKNMVIAGPAIITRNRTNNKDNFCTLRLIPTPNINGVGQ